MTHHCSVPGAGWYPQHQVSRKAQDKVKVEHNLPWVVYNLVLVVVVVVVFHRQGWHTNHAYQYLAHS